MDSQELEDRLIRFAVMVIRLSIDLPEMKSGTILSGQLFRSGKSPALN